MKYFQSLFSHWSTFAVPLGVIIAFLQPSIDAYTKAHPHALAAVLIGAALAAYHLTAPKDAADAKQQQLGNGAKSIALVLCVLIGLSAVSHAQDSPSNIYAAGISFNNNGSPAVAGTGLYARLINDGMGTYAFTVVDALPQNTKPFTVTSNFGAGIAQRAFLIGNVPIYIPSSAGISFNGTNTGWAWSTGALASVKLKGNWRVFPNVRIVKSSVTNGTGYQPIVGVLFGWGS